MIERIREALQKGCIVMIGNVKVRSIEVVTGPRGARILRIVDEYGQTLEMYESRLRSIRPRIIC